MSPRIEKVDPKLATFILTHGRDYVTWSSQLEIWLYEQELMQYIIGYVEEVDEPDFNSTTPPSRAEAKKYFEWRSQNA